MRAWRTSIVASLGLGRGNASIQHIRNDGILICRVRDDKRDHYFDLGTGLLHSSDPNGSVDEIGRIRSLYLDEAGRAPRVLEQLVVALANPQVKVDHLFQGLKASSIILPKEVKIIRNYLGGVIIMKDGQSIHLGSLISFVVENSTRGERVMSKGVDPSDERSS